MCTETLVTSEPKMERFITAIHPLDFTVKRDAAKCFNKRGFVDPPGRPHSWLESKEDSIEN